MNQTADFKKIIRHFAFRSRFLRAKPYGCGHINDTYTVLFEDGDHSLHRYILQRANTRIFHNPEMLMHNIEQVTSHIQKKIRERGGIPERETLVLIPTTDGRSFYCTNSGEYWRSYAFIEGARTYQTVENSRHFYSSGYAFGKFQNDLADFDASGLYEVIPDFHNTRVRLRNFNRSVRLDTAHRAGDGSLCLRRRDPFGRDHDGRGRPRSFKGMVRSGTVPLLFRRLYPCGRPVPHRGGASPDAVFRVADDTGMRNAGFLPTISTATYTTRSSGNAIISTGSGIN